jgi:putative acetyltransferase
MRMAVETSTEITVRPARDNDSADLIELIGGCYAEYPGCYLEVPEEEPWLLEPATAYGHWRGRLWVVERDGKVVASGGMRPSGPGDAGVHHLYVARSQRHQGLATRLLELIEAEAGACRGTACGATIPFAKRPKREALRCSSSASTPPRR